LKFVILVKVVDPAKITVPLPGIKFCDVSKLAPEPVKVILDGAVKEEDVLPIPNAAVLNAFPFAVPAMVKLRLEETTVPAVFPMLRLKNCVESDEPEILWADVLLKVIRPALAAKLVALLVKSPKIVQEEEVETVDPVKVIELKVKLPAPSMVDPAKVRFALLVPFTKFDVPETERFPPIVTAWVLAVPGVAALKVPAMLVSPPILTVLPVPEASNCKVAPKFTVRLLVMFKLQLMVFVLVPTTRL